MEAETTRYQFDTVEVNPAAFSVLRDGKPLDLEPKAVRVLLLLIDNRHRVVSKEEIFDAVWADTAVTDNALTRIIAQIRRELGDDARQARFIQTLPTTGYRFIADLKTLEDRPAPPPAPLDPPAQPPARGFPRASIAAIGAAILLGAGALLYRSGLLTEPTILRSVQVTTSPSLDIAPSFSPDGRSFAYSSDRPGKFEIYTRNLSGTAPDVQLTSDGKQNIDPAWSPDGRWIAYHSVAEHGIWLVPAAGGTPKRLTQFGSQPAWSPDGRQIVFRSGEPISLAWFDIGGSSPSVLWTVAADGSQLRQITTIGVPTGQQSMPTWSPDGKRILFIALSPQSAIYQMDLATGRHELLLQVSRELPRRPGTWWTRVWDPRYGPGGKGLYFSAQNSQGDYAIFFQRRGGERPTELYSARTDVPTGIAVSPDGRNLLLTRLSSVSQIWTLDAKGDPKPLFQEAVLRAYLPAFSPDGKLLSLMVEISGRNRDLWIMNADGTGAAPVSQDPGPKEGGVMWTPNGKMLYTYFNESGMEFRRYDPTEKNSSVLYRFPANLELFHPSLLPNEKEILSACSKPLNICIGPAQGGSPRQLTFEQAGASYPNLSPDGQWLSFNVRRGVNAEVGIVHRNGSQSQVITDDPGLNWAYSFASDNRRIAYAAFREGVWNLWWIDRVTRERKQLTHNTAFGSFVRSPAWRPNSEEIVFEKWQAKGNIHLLQLP